MNKYYRTLDIPCDAPLSEVRRAYRDMVLVWHPDRFPGNERLQKQATEKLIEINKAYRMLRTGSRSDRVARGMPLPAADEPIDWSPIARRVTPAFSAERHAWALENLPRRGSSFEALKARVYYVLAALVVLWLTALTFVSR